MEETAHTLQRRARTAHLCRELRQSGLSLAELARRAECSRQFAWQVIHGTAPASEKVVSRFERLLTASMEEWALGMTTGRRLRRARRRAGFTLKETAALIGYTWIAVERWEQDMCLPKPGVLWHLCRVYGEDPSWIPLIGRYKQTLPMSAAQND